MSEIDWLEIKYILYLIARYERRFPLPHVWDLLGQKPSREATR